GGQTPTTSSPQEIEGSKCWIQSTSAFGASPSAGSVVSRTRPLLPMVGPWSIRHKGNLIQGLEIGNLYTSFFLDRVW
ncbi:hypothetical protein VK792_06630, partial [Mesobacterium sp. TK19101]